MSKDNILNKYTLEQIEDFIDEIISNCVGRSNCNDCIFRDKSKNCYFCSYKTPDEWEMHINDIPHIFKF